MKINFSQATKVFFNPEISLPFILGSVFLSVLGNSTTQLLFNSIGTSTPSVIKIALGAVLIFGLSALLLTRGLAKLRSPQLKLDKSTPAKQRGLILLVSKPEPCREAIAYHLPALEQCWLICSKESLKTANELRDEFTNEKIREPIVVNDVFDPLEFYRCVKSIYAHLPKGWSEQDVIADFTGMTANASVGMVLATLSRQYPLEYTPAEIDKQGKQTGRSLPPIEIILRPQSNDKKINDKR